MDLLTLFDEVMRAPESARGTDVLETCRLLAESVKRHFPIAEYETTLLKLRDIYLDQFLHTCSIDPTFSSKIRDGIQFYI
jgi:hypothetical protein